MNKYLIGQTFTIPLVTDEVPAGKAVSWSLSFNRVAPEAEVQPSYLGADTVANNPTGAYLLPASVAEIDRRSIWQLSWIIVDDNDVNHSYSETIMMEAEDTLVKGENSFQSYYSALMLAEELPGTDAFKSMQKQEQTAGLSQAYRMISSMTFMSRGQIVYNIASLNAAELDTLDPGLLEALRIAQILEANEALDANSPHAKRLDGIMSETIGESSMMFRAGKVATNTALSRRAMGFLRKYLVITARIERV